MSATCTDLGTCFRSKFRLLYPPIIAVDSSRAIIASIHTGLNIAAYERQYARRCKRSRATSEGGENRWEGCRAQQSEQPRTSLCTVPSTHCATDTNLTSGAASAAALRTSNPTHHDKLIRSATDRRCWTRSILHLGSKHCPPTISPTRS